MFLKEEWESTINQLYKFSKTNKLYINDSKTIEQGNETKISAYSIDQFISKWRKDSK